MIKYRFSTGFFANLMIATGIGMNFGAWQDDINAGCFMVLICHLSLVAFDRLLEKL